MFGSKRSCAHPSSASGDSGGDPSKALEVVGRGLLEKRPKRYYPAYAMPSTYTRPTISAPPSRRYDISMIKLDENRNTNDIVIKKSRSHINPLEAVSFFSDSSDSRPSTPYSLGPKPDSAYYSEYHDQDEENSFNYAENNDNVNESQGRLRSSTTLSKVSMPHPPTPYRSTPCQKDKDAQSCDSMEPDQKQTTFREKEDQTTIVSRNKRRIFSQKTFISGDRKCKNFSEEKTSFCHQAIEDAGGEGASEPGEKGGNFSSHEEQTTIGIPHQATADAEGGNAGGDAGSVTDSCDQNSLHHRLSDDGVSNCSSPGDVLNAYTSSWSITSDEGGSSLTDSPPLLGGSLPKITNDEADNETPTPTFDHFIIGFHQEDHSTGVSPYDNCRLPEDNNPNHGLSHHIGQLDRVPNGSANFHGEFDQGEIADIGALKTAKEYINHQLDRTFVRTSSGEEDSLGSDPRTINRKGGDRKNPAILRRPKIHRGNLAQRAVLDSDKTYIISDISQGITRQNIRYPGYDYTPYARHTPATTATSGSDSSSTLEYNSTSPEYEPADPLMIPDPPLPPINIDAEDCISNKRTHIRSETVVLDRRSSPPENQIRLPVIETSEGRDKKSLGFKMEDIDREREGGSMETTDPLEMLPTLRVSSPATRGATPTDPTSGTSGILTNRLNVTQLLHTESTETGVFMQLKRIQDLDGLADKKATERYKEKIDPALSGSVDPGIARPKMERGLKVSDAETRLCQPAVDCDVTKTKVKDVTSQSNVKDVTSPKVKDMRYVAITTDTADRRVDKQSLADRAISPKKTKENQLNATFIVSPTETVLGDHSSIANRGENALKTPVKMENDSDNEPEVRLASSVVGEDPAEDFLRPSSSTLDFFDQEIPPADRPSDSVRSSNRKTNPVGSAGTVNIGSYAENEEQGLRKLSPKSRSESDVAEIRGRDIPCNRQCTLRTTSRGAASASCNTLLQTCQMPRNLKGAIDAMSQRADASYDLLDGEGDEGTLPLTPHDGESDSSFHFDRAQLRSALRQGDGLAVILLEGGSIENPFPDGAVVISNSRYRRGHNPADSSTGSAEHRQIVVTLRPSLIDQYRYLDLNEHIRNLERAEGNQTTDSNNGSHRSRELHLLQGFRQALVEMRLELGLQQQQQRQQQQQQQAGDGPQSDNDNNASNQQPEQQQQQHGPDVVPYPALVRVCVPANNNLLDNNQNDQNQEVRAEDEVQINAPVNNVNQEVRVENEVQINAPVNNENQEVRVENQAQNNPPANNENHEVKVENQAQINAPAYNENREVGQNNGINANIGNGNAPEDRVEGNDIGAGVGASPNEPNPSAAVAYASSSRVDKAENIEAPAKTTEQVRGSDDAKSSVGGGDNQYDDYEDDFEDGGLEEVEDGCGGSRARSAVSEGAKSSTLSPDGAETDRSTATENHIDSARSVQAEVKLDSTGGGGEDSDSYSEDSPPEDHQDKSDTTYSKSSTNKPMEKKPSALSGHLSESVPPKASSSKAIDDEWKLQLEMNTTKAPHSQATAAAARRTPTASPVQKKKVFGLVPEGKALPPVRHPQPGQKHRQVTRTWKSTKQPSTSPGGSQEKQTTSPDHKPAAGGARGALPWRPKYPGAHRSTGPRSTRLTHSLKSSATAYGVKVPKSKAVGSLSTIKKEVYSSRGGDARRNSSPREVNVSKLPPVENPSRSSAESLRNHNKAASTSSGSTGSVKSNSDSIDSVKSNENVKKPIPTFGPRQNIRALGISARTLREIEKPQPLGEVKSAQELQSTSDSTERPYLGEKDVKPSQVRQKNRQFNNSSSRTATVQTTSRSKMAANRSLSRRHGQTDSHKLTSRSGISAAAQRQKKNLSSLPSALKSDAYWQNGQLHIRVHGPARLLTAQTPEVGEEGALHVTAFSEEKPTVPLDVRITLVRDPLSNKRDVNSGQNLSGYKGPLVDANSGVQTGSLKASTSNRTIVNTRAVHAQFNTRMARVAAVPRGRLRPLERTSSTPTRQESTSSDSK